MKKTIKTTTSLTLNKSAEMRNKLDRAEQLINEIKDLMMDFNLKININK